MRIGICADIEDYILGENSLHSDNGLALHTLDMDKFALSICKIDLGKHSKSLDFIRSCSVREFL